MSKYLFGFDEEPFGIDPDSRFFYRDAPRQYVYTHLASSICQRKGLILLAGEHGIGKTILLRHLADELQTVYGVVLLSPSGVLSCESSPSLGDIVRTCRLRSGNPDDCSDDEDNTGDLAELLIRGKDLGVSAVLLLDDAENLPEEVLERFMALSAQPMDERGGISIVLAGDLTPPKGLSSSAFETAQQRANLSLRLQKFQDRDVEPYISHRMRVAGRDGPMLFSPSAVNRIFRHSKGNPLSINRICRSALVIAGLQDRKTVSAEIIDKVAAGGQGGTSGERSEQWGFDTTGTADLKPPTALPNSAHMVTRKGELESDGPRPTASGSIATAATSEDIGEKFSFRGDTGTAADKVTEIAALARISSLRPLEEYAQTERVGSWSNDKAGILLRLVWTSLAVTLVVGATSVYLAQTGRLDIVGLSREWLDLVMGRESALTQNDQQRIDLVGGKPSYWVEPSNKDDQAYPSKGDSNVSGGKPVQVFEDQRPTFAEPERGTGPLDQSGRETQPKAALERTGSPTEPGSILLSSAKVEGIGSAAQSRPTPETDVSPESPQLTANTEGGVEPDNRSESPIALIGAKPAAGLEQVLDAPATPMQTDLANRSDQKADRLGALLEPKPTLVADETIKITGSAREQASKVETDASGRDGVPGSEGSPEPESVAGNEGPKLVAPRESVAEVQDTGETLSSAFQVESAPQTKETTRSRRASVERDTTAENAAVSASSAMVVDMETAAGTEQTIVGTTVAVEGIDTAPSDMTKDIRSPIDTAPGSGFDGAPESLELADGSKSMAALGKPVETPALTVESRNTGESEGGIKVAGLPAKLHSATVAERTTEKASITIENAATKELAGAGSSPSVPQDGVTSSLPPTTTAAVSESLPAGSSSGMQPELHHSEPPDHPFQAPQSIFGRDRREDSEGVKRAAEEVPAAMPSLDRDHVKTSELSTNNDAVENLQTTPAVGGRPEVTLPKAATSVLPAVGEEPQNRPGTASLGLGVLSQSEPLSTFEVAETAHPDLDLDRLLARGDEFFALGDVASARLFYRLAAAQGSAKGATAMGSTFDPLYLERFAVVGVRPSPTEAVKWYQKAIDMGYSGAKIQLRELVTYLERAEAQGDPEAKRILQNIRN